MAYRNIDIPPNPNTNVKKKKMIIHSLNAKHKKRVNTILK